MKFIKKIKLNIEALRNLLYKEKKLIQEKSKEFNNYILFDGVEVVNSEIGQFTYVSKYSIIHNCIIGKFSSIGPNVVIGYGEHPVNYLSTAPLFYAAKEGMFGQNLYSDNDFPHNEKVYIGNDVWIGANVYIKNGIKIGDGAVVGAGAVVTKDVAPYSIVVGVPAQCIKYRFSEVVIKKLLILKWWDWDIQKIAKNKYNFVNNDVDKIIQALLKDEQ